MLSIGIIPNKLEIIRASGVCVVMGRLYTGKLRPKVSPTPSKTLCRSLASIHLIGAKRCSRKPIYSMVNKLSASDRGTRRKT